MSAFPSANLVSRALRRDAGIIPVPRSRFGYHVSGGGDFPVVIGVQCSHSPEQFPDSDVRRASDLHGHLSRHGWELDPIDPEWPVAIKVRRVPGAAEARAAAEAHNG